MSTFSSARVTRRANFFTNSQVTCRRLADLRGGCTNRRLETILGLPDDEITELIIAGAIE